MNIDTIIAAVSGYYGMSRVEIFGGNSRMRVLAREIVFKLAHDLTIASNAEIARAVNMEHNTIGDAIKRFDTHYAENELFRRDVDIIKRSLP